MRKWLVTSVLVGLLVLLPVAAAQDGDTLPTQIDVTREGFFPEGIEYDAAGERFLLGSLAEGTIFAVADDGAITPFIEDEALASSVGIHIDVAGERLLVANTDRSTGAIALGAYDLASGERLFMADLNTVAPEGGHFANDVTVDTAGNAYVTDSFAGVLYRVTPEGEPTLFLQADAFASSAFGLNGLDFHPDGYLLVAKADAGQLFKVPVDDPEAFSEVVLDAPVSGADGIVLAEDGTLYVVGQPQKVFAVQSMDDWQTASIAASADLDDAATTAALRDGVIYVIFAQLSQMQASDPPDVYVIAQVPFEGLSVDAPEAAAEDSGGTASENAGDSAGDKLGY